MAEKILIVDDDIDSLKLIGLMLQRQGYEITAANAGAQAIAKAASDSPDLIILDIMMPDMDGYEVCRRLRADPKTQGIPIIMFTAKTLVDDKVAGFEAGADDYLTKPTHPAELASRVRAILARSAAKRGAAPEQAKLLAVMGAKGGVGTSTVAANVAAALAKKAPTILGDVRPGQGSLGAALGFEQASGFANLLTRHPRDITIRTVTDELVNHGSGMRLLLSSTRPKEANLAVSPDAVAVITQQLRALSKVVVLDIGIGLTLANQRMLQSITHLLVVVDSQRATLNMARGLLGELAALGLSTSQISIVLVNRTQSSLQLSWQEAEQILGRDMLAIISPAPELAFQAGEAGIPLIAMQPNAIVPNQLQKLADDLAVRMQIA
ncbi:MAG: response regulator [Anaerolineae bacterium]|nr:response regulator [Anaerolineae bacterium]